MSSQEAVHVSPRTVTPNWGKETLSRRMGWNEAVGKPRKTGCMRASALTSRKLGRLTEEMSRFRTGPGKTGRPGLSGGLRKRSHGGNENPPRNRKSELGNPPPTVGAPEFYPNQFQTGKLGGCNATMTELWNAALAA